MPQQVFQVISSKGETVISPEELKERYFFGIPIIDSQGVEMPRSTIIDFIDMAVTELEGYLALKLTKQIVIETLDYMMNDWQHWGYIPTSFPVLKVYGLSGSIGLVQKQIIFPVEWLSVKKSTDPYAAHRKVEIVPSMGSAGGSKIIFSGISPQLGWFSMNTIPDYWQLEYCTSFKKAPPDILDLVGKLAAINIFNNMGDIILGAGIASQSIGVDGLSQSISTTSSATNAGYGARIVQYVADLKRELPHLKNKYKGVTFTAL